MNFNPFALSLERPYNLPYLRMFNSGLGFSGSAFGCCCCCCFPFCFVGETIPDGTSDSSSSDEEDDESSEGRMTFFNDEPPLIVGVPAFPPLGELVGPELDLVRRKFNVLWESDPRVVLDAFVLLTGAIVLKPEKY